MNIVIKKAHSKDIAMFCIYLDNRDSIGYSGELIDLHITGVQAFSALTLATIDERYNFKGYMERYFKDDGHVNWYKDLKRLKELGYLKIYRKNNKNYYEIHVLFT